MTPAQKRRAKRRKCLQRKNKPETKMVKLGGRWFGERLVTGNPDETLQDLRRITD